MRRARKENQVVAAGPKTTGRRWGQIRWNSSREREEGREGVVPPPYKAIRPVRLKLCLEGPTFSTACWAMTSPVAKSTCDRRHRPSVPELPLMIRIESCQCFTRTAVVMLCVSNGRRASLVWYLRWRGWLAGGARVKTGVLRIDTIVTCWGLYRVNRRDDMSIQWSEVCTGRILYV